MASYPQITEPTNFRSTLEQKTVWARETWKVGRNNSFLAQFMSKGQDAMITRVTELTKDERGDRVVMPLVADMQNPGIVGDNILEGREEALVAKQAEMTIDHLRHAARSKGKMNDQRTVINFKTQAKDKLGYWLADTMDQLALLTLAGVHYCFTTTGALRPGFRFHPTTAGVIQCDINFYKPGVTAIWVDVVDASGNNIADQDQVQDQWIALAYAKQVSAPSGERGFRWTANNGLDGMATNAVTSADTINYDAFAEIRAKARRAKLRPVRTKNGIDLYHCFISTEAMSALKRSPDFKENARLAENRGDSNSLFKGLDTYMIDGMMIHSFNHSYSTIDAQLGDKWGAAGDVDGFRMVVAGAQAMGFADIDGGGTWEEEGFDYNNAGGIAYGKISGFFKPRFAAEGANDGEDYGVMTVDFAL